MDKDDKSVILADRADGAESSDSPDAPPALMAKGHDGLDYNKAYFSKSYKRQMTACQWEDTAIGLWTGQPVDKRVPTWRHVARNNPDFIKEFWAYRQVEAIDLYRQIISLCEQRPVSAAANKAVDREIRVKQAMLAKVLPEVFGETQAPAAVRSVGTHPLVEISVGGDSPRTIKATTVK